MKSCLLQASCHEPHHRSARKLCVPPPLFHALWLAVEYFQGRLCCLRARVGTLGVSGSAFASQAPGPATSRASTTNPITTCQTNSPVATLSVGSSLTINGSIRQAPKLQQSRIWLGTPVHGREIHCPLRTLHPSSGFSLASQMRSRSRSSIYKVHW